MMEYDGETNSYIVHCTRNFGHASPLSLHLTNSLQGPAIKELQR